MTPFEERLKKFQGKRVLHIGNIANNAYINAKIMRKHGIKADVLCADYYHIMGCPEWDESELDDASAIDEFSPNWKDVDLKGFKRPSWFYQGKRLFALKALLYKHEHKKIREWFYLYLMKLTCNKKNNLIKVYFDYKFICNDFFKMILLCRQYTKNFLYNSLTFFGVKPKPSLQSISHKNKLFSKIISYYDIVQSYATDGIHMLNEGRTDFAAYEHGTIRDIPFEDNEQGRSCRDVYIKASVVFITNTDCVKAADKLNIPKERQFPVPHAFDSDKAFRFKEKWASQIKPFDIPTFFAPARHHWKEGFISWLKGNDRIIKAASLLKKENIPFKIIFIEWGKEVDLSKELIHNLGVDGVIEWWKPLTKFQLWQTYLKVDGIIDQLIIPALGGVCFETLSIGKPLFTRIDEDVLEDFFGKAPPVFNVKDEHTLAEALKPLLFNRHVYSERVEEGKQWISEYHSSQRILDIHLKAYEKIIKERESL